MTISIAIFISFYVLVLAQDCFQTCTVLQTHQCTICYNHCTNSTSQTNPFKINRCSYTNNKDQLILLDDKNCGLYCCQYFQYFQQTSFTLEKIDQCIANNDISHFQNPLIVVIVYCFVGGFIFLLCISSIWACLNKKQNYENQDEDGDDKDLTNLEWKIFSEDNSTNVSMWSSQKNKQEKCSICLDKLCDIKTACCHLYHTDCLLQWLKKGKLCPNCRSTKVKPLEVICHICRKYCLSVVSKGQILELEKMIKGKKTVCDKCSCDENNGNESFDGGWVDGSQK